MNIRPEAISYSKKVKHILLFLLITVAARAEEIQVFFSPKGGCTEAVVENLSRAKSNVLVQAYSFTSAPIEKALVDASKRGVKVQVTPARSSENQLDHVTIEIFGFQIQPPLPRWLAPNSVCQWFSFREQPLKRL